MNKVSHCAHVEAGSSTSTMTLQVEEGDEKGNQCLGYNWPTLTLMQWELIPHCIRFFLIIKFNSHHVNPMHFVFLTWIYKIWNFILVFIFMVFFIKCFWMLSWINIKYHFAIQERIMWARTHFSTWIVYLLAYIFHELSEIQNIPLPNPSHWIHISKC
jgi:hypothetical protein